VNECIDDYSRNEFVQLVKATALSDHHGVHYAGHDVWLGNNITIALAPRMKLSFERHFAIHYPDFESLTDITNASK
jgi:hypothetical protein